MPNGLPGVYNFLNFLVSETKLPFIAISEASPHELPPGLNSEFNGCVVLPKIGFDEA